MCQRMSFLVQSLRSGVSLSPSERCFLEMIAKQDPALNPKVRPVPKTQTYRRGMTWSRIYKGVNVDESVVMSSSCKALGVAYAPKGFTKDARAEGVAQMMLTVREKWDRPITAKLLTTFHAALMKGEENRVAVGAFRSHREPMRVIRRHADGTVEVRYVAPPSEQVPKEIAAFVKLWKASAVKPADIALKAAMLHPHFESIHPFEDGNGRVGRALVSKVIAEGLGLPLILPVSTIIARHRVASRGVLR